MANPDRHKRDPITYRPPGDTHGWLEDIAEREGRGVRAVVGEAVERARFISESDLAALDREVTRRTMALFTARTEGRDSSAEQASADAAIEAYRHAIGRWQPPRTGLTW